MKPATNLSWDNMDSDQNCVSQSRISLLFSERVFSLSRLFWIFVHFLFFVCPKQSGLSLISQIVLHYSPVATYQNSDCIYTSIIPEGKTTTAQAVSEGDSSSSLPPDSNPPNPNSVQPQCSEVLGVAALSHKALGTETKVYHLPQLTETQYKSSLKVWIIANYRTK